MENLKPKEVMMVMALQIGHSLDTSLEEILPLVPKEHHKAIHDSHERVKRDMKKILKGEVLYPEAFT